MPESDEAVARLREKFLKHMAEQNREAFSAPEQMSMAISVLTRDLQAKREQGTLSDSEQRVLSEIDRLWEDIEKFNNQARDPKAAFMAEHVYDLKGQISQPPEPAATVVSEPVKISQAEADEIIEGLNRQFEEKVLSKLHPQGRNLQDYRSSVDDAIRS